MLIPPSFVKSPKLQILLGSGKPATIKEKKKIIYGNVLTKVFQSLQSFTSETSSLPTLASSVTLMMKLSNMHFVTIKILPPFGKTLQPLKTFIMKILKPGFFKCHKPLYK